MARAGAGRRPTRLREIRAGTHVDLRPAVLPWGQPHGVRPFPRCRSTGACVPRDDGRGHPVRFFRAVSRGARRATQVITLQHPELEPFNQMLRARTSVAPVTPDAHRREYRDIRPDGVGPAPPRRPQYPRWMGRQLHSTHDERRVVASRLDIVPSYAWIHLLANVIGLLQLGLVLERLVGPIAFGAVISPRGCCSAS